MQVNPFGVVVWYVWEVRQGWRAGQCDPKLINDCTLPNSELQAKTLFTSSNSAFTYPLRWQVDAIYLKEMGTMPIPFDKLDISISWILTWLVYYVDYK